MSAFAGLEEQAEPGLGEQEVRWEDVTQNVREACEALGLGGMVMRKGFTLHDSMNALELMSPKMDAGMDPDGVKPVDQRLRDGDLRIPVERGEDMLALCRMTLAMEAAWYEGHGLATSVHSCVFLHKDAMDVLQDKSSTFNGNPQASTNDEDVLALTSFAFFVVVAKTCFAVRKLVRLADIYEEEDFSATLLRGLFMAHGVDDPWSLLDTATQALEHKRDTAPSDALSAKMCEQLLATLRFRRLYLTFVDVVNARDAAWMDKAAALLTELAALHDLVGPGRTASPEEEAAAQRVAAFALDPAINRKLLWNAPPRAVPQLDLQGSHEELARMLDHLARAFALREERSLLGIYRGMHRLSALQPNIVVRSALVPMLFSEDRLCMELATYEDLIRQDMEQHLVPAHALSTESAQAYIRIAIKPVYDVLRLLTGNRARQRRGITNMLPEWGGLQQEAETKDQAIFVELRPELEGSLNTLDADTLRKELHFSLYEWTASWTARLIWHHLLLGYELELYYAVENESVLYYLQHVLKTLLDAQSSLEESFTAEYRRLQNEQIAAEQERAAKTKKRAPGKKKPSAARLRTQQAELDLRCQLAEARMAGIKGQLKVLREEGSDSPAAVEKSEIEAHRSLADSLLRVLMGMRLQGKVRPVEFAFASDKVRYHRRMEAYTVVTSPTWLNFEHFQVVTDLTKYDASELLRTAQASVSRCKGLLAEAIKAGSLGPEETLRWRALLKIAVSTGLLALKLATKPEPAAGAALHVTFDQACRAFPLLSYE